MKSSKHKRLPRRSALAVLVWAAWGLSAFALPQGATVVNGQVSIQQAAPGTQVINASHGAIINWKQFSIGRGETTQFVQPSSASAVLNRVVGNEASSLLGNLRANGQVFLINPNGIVVGGAARIDTNSFIASTLDIADGDFIAGKLRFFAGPGAGRIRNEGIITAGPGGRIALIAPDIENTGIIQSPDGQILLAAGRKLEITSADLEGVSFEIQAPTDSVLNLGKLLAENGAVRVFAGNLRHSGEIRASRMVRDADGSIVLAGSNDLVLTSDSITSANGLAGGAITLQSSGGTARVSGQVSATGSDGKGGDIRILGERVAVEAGAHVDVSGSAGGGQILVGGDFQGRNPLVQNATRVHVAAGAELLADATDQGDGGRVIVWADKDTRYAGRLSATGGQHGGDGGFAEVSGKANLQFTGSASLTAPMGSSGTLLLDPLDLIVSSTSGLLPTVADEFADFVGNVVTVAPATLAAVGASVVLQAERDVYIKDAIALSAPGAGISITAGGETFANGSIFNTAGISTVGGAVTLRADSITGAGITTSGGAVDLMARDSLNYNGNINSGGGAVTLASQFGSVFNASVQAGAGAIQVSPGTLQVSGQSDVSGGNYATSGAATFTAGRGNINVDGLTVGTANLNASGSISATVDATDRVNAASSGSIVQLFSGSGPLRLGTLSGSSGIYLYSSTGIQQASGGVLTSSFFQFSLGGSAVASGSPGAPLLLAAPSAQVEPRIQMYGMQAPVHLAFSGSPTLGGLLMDGSVAAIGASTVAAAGTANLTSLSLSGAGGVLGVSAVATGGFGNGFQLDVNDGAINATTLTLPGAPVQLSAAGPVTVGTMTGGSLNVQAQGPVSITSATTTATSGISVYVQSCDSGTTACLNQSPITAGTLAAGGTGDVSLATYDNGDITVTNLSAGDRIDVEAGQNYRTSPFSSNYTDQPTNNNIVLGTVVSGGRTSIENRGQGDVTVTSLSAGDLVDVSAGTSFTPVAFTSQRTNNVITIGNVEPVGAINDFRVSNTGIGALTVTGAVDRTASGDISLSTFNGSIAALGALSARDTISITSGGATSTLSVGTLTAGTASFNGTVNLSAGANLLFDSISSTAPSATSGTVTLTSTNGSIKTAIDNTGADIVASGNVTLTASQATNGVIGESTFTNPLDIRAGTGRVVTLTAGLNVGAPGKAVNVDADGSLIVSAANGQFHVAATDGTTEKSLSTIRLSGSAAGIGAGNSATFRSLDLDVTADSDGSTLAIGDLVRSNGTLNDFQFFATGTSALTYGNVNFSSTGLNQLVLNATNGLDQNTPLTNSITAGTVTLASGTGDLSAGDITARSARLSGGAMALRSVTTNGTARSTFNATADILSVASSGDVTFSGALASATVINVSSNGNLVVGGAVTGTGSSRNTFRAENDRVRLQATGDITTGGAVTSQTMTSVVAGGSIQVGGSGIDGGITGQSGNNAGDSLVVTAGTSGTIDVQSITDGSTKTVEGGTLIVPGGITGASQSTTVRGTTFDTGNIATGGPLSITATAAYAPGAPIALSATGNLSINAPGGIDLATSGTTLTSPQVTLTASAGNIVADLTGTTNLTVNTGGMFDLSSTVALSSLNVTADGALAGAGAGSSVSANGGGQLLGYVATGNSLALQMQSNASLSNRYTESSAAITDLAVGSTGTFTGSVIVSAPAANITTPSLATTSSVNLSTGDGDISLTSLTAGGGINVSTSTGNITLTDVQTAGSTVTALTTGDATSQILVERIRSVGGSVSLTAENGSIVRAGTQPLQIDSRNGQLLASGTMTLSAAGGSVGTAVAPILTSGASVLNINGSNEIAVDAANTPVGTLIIVTSASGTGAVSVTNSNFSGLSIQRVGGTELDLGALTPGTLASFSLTATDGNLRVVGDLGNINSLLLNAGRNFNSTGDLVIQAAGGPRSISANIYELQAGRDIRILAGAQAVDDVSINQTGTSGATNLFAGRDISVLANGGSALLGHSGTNGTQTLSAGRDITVAGGTAGLAGATAAIAALGSQTLSASNNLTVQGGSADQSSARITATQSQNMTNVLGTLSVLGGSGADALAEIVSSASSQSLGTTSSVTDLVLVQGGTGSNSAASIRAATIQNILSSGDIRVIGGSGAGSDAALVAGTTQTVGNTTVPNFSFNDPTNAILVQAGSGGTARILAGGTQAVRGSEGLSVLGGSGTGMFASIETTGGTQSIGTSGTNQNNPTDDIVLQAGSGDGAFASIKASGTQTISTGGIIDVLGGAGAGAFAEILSTTGGQTIGSTSTSSNDATGSITVRAGSGGIARIQAQSFQTIRTGGDLSVIGGDAANLTASIVSVASSQTIGQTGIFSNDASGSILVQAGTATGAAASITAATGQTIDAGGTIMLIGNLAGGSAQISTTSGNQTIGNTNCCSTDQTDSITLSGGSAAGAFARISTGGFQSVSTSADLNLLGGDGDNTGALLLAGAGQSLISQGDVALVGGTASAAGLNETGIRNTSGNQAVFVWGQVALTGGGVGSDTWIRQNGTGTQSLTIGTDLSLLAPAASPGAGETSIAAMGTSQSLSVGGAISINNQGGTSAFIGTSGVQDITAQSLAISLSSVVGATPFAGVTANGNQSITLNGDGANDGTATLSLQNLSAATNSLAAIRSLGTLDIQMNYDAAGLMSIGSTNGLGATTVAAAGDLTIVAGRLLLQGGASTAADAKILAGAQPPAAPTNNMLISTLFGPVEMLGGAAGGAFIDPLELNIVSNGTVLMLAGLGSTANTNITAGTVNVAPTTGGLSLINSATSTATSTITAGTFNLIGAGNLNLNGGTITVVNPSTIDILGICTGCTTNLLPPDLFDVQAGAPPPPTNFGADVAADILALSESSIDMFELAIDENGEVVFTRRRLNQCY